MATDFDLNAVPSECYIFLTSLFHVNNCADISRLSGDIVALESPSRSYMEYSDKAYRRHGRKNIVQRIHCKGIGYTRGVESLV
jgi:hypothetical protein